MHRYYSFMWINALTKTAVCTARVKIQRAFLSALNLAASVHMQRVLHCAPAPRMEQRSGMTWGKRSDCLTPAGLMAMLGAQWQGYVFVGQSSGADSQALMVAGCEAEAACSQPLEGRGTCVCTVSDLF